MNLRRWNWNDFTPPSLEWPEVRESLVLIKMTWHRLLHPLEWRFKVTCGSACVTNNSDCWGWSLAWRGCQNVQQSRRSNEKITKLIFSETFCALGRFRQCWSVVRCDTQEHRFPVEYRREVLPPLESGDKRRLASFGETTFGTNFSASIWAIAYLYHSGRSIPCCDCRDVVSGNCPQ